MIFCDYFATGQVLGTLSAGNAWHTRRMLCRYNRAIALEHLGHVESALDSYGRAAAAYYADDDGNAHSQSTREDTVQTAARALSNRGNLLIKHERASEGVASCAAALALSPDYASARLNLGVGRYSWLLTVSSCARERPQN
jgi:tetratricopeptide (TPR) repeat protein